MNPILIPLLLLCVLAIVAAIIAEGYGRLRPPSRSFANESEHANGVVTMTAEAVLLPNQLVGKGTAANGVIVNVLASEAWGVALTGAAIGDPVAVRMLPAGAGTVKLIGGAAVTAGARVYTAATGRVSSTAASTSFLVGRAVEACAAAGDTFEVTPLSPVVQP